MLRVDGDSQSIYLQGVMVSIDPAFKLYVPTELTNPKFLPEVAVFTNFINFAVTQEGLEAQLLSVIVSERMAKVEKKFEDTYDEIKENKEFTIASMNHVHDVVNQFQQNFQDEL